MSQVTHFICKLLAITTSGLTALVATSVVWAVSAGETVTIRGTELQNKADHYAALASFYRSLAKPGTKHMITYFTAANRADHLEEHYRLAAAETRHKG